MSKPNCQVTAYYIPLEVEFYAPPTAEHIKLKGIPIIKKRLEAVCNLINNLKNSKQGKVAESSDKNLRVMIIDHLFDEAIFLTADRKVIKNNEVFQIERKIFDAALEEIIAATK